MRFLECVRVVVITVGNAPELSDDGACSCHFVDHFLSSNCLCRTCKRRELPPEFTDLRTDIADLVQRVRESTMMSGRRIHRVLIQCLAPLKYATALEGVETTMLPVDVAEKTIYLLLLDVNSGSIDEIYYGTNDSVTHSSSRRFFILFVEECASSESFFLQ